jgi:hypothetical protein
MWIEGVLSHINMQVKQKQPTPFPLLAICVFVLNLFAVSNFACMLLSPKSCVSCQWFNYIAICVNPHWTLDRKEYR